MFVMELGYWCHGSPIEYTASDVPGRFRPPSPPLQLPPPPGARLPAGPFQLRVGMFPLRAAATEIGREHPGRRHHEVAAAPLGDAARSPADPQPHGSPPPTQTPDTRRGRQEGMRKWKSR